MEHIGGVRMNNLLSRRGFFGASIVSLFAVAASTVTGFWQKAVDREGLPFEYWTGTRNPGYVLRNDIRWRIYSEDVIRVWRTTTDSPATFGESMKWHRAEVYA